MAQLVIHLCNKISKPQNTSYNRNKGARGQRWKAKSRENQHQHSQRYHDDDDEDYYYDNNYKNYNDYDNYNSRPSKPKRARRHKNYPSTSFTSRHSNYNSNHNSSRHQAQDRSFARSNNHHHSHNTSNPRHYNTKKLSHNKYHVQDGAAPYNTDKNYRSRSFKSKSSQSYSQLPRAHNHGHSHYNQHHNNNQSHSRNQSRGHNVSSSVGSSRGPRIRAPIEQCNSQFMRHVMERNKNDNEQKEEKKDDSYTWRDQVDFLSCDVDKDIQTKPIDIITNTFPIELSKDINILKYDITANKRCDFQRTFKRFNAKKLLQSHFDAYLIDKTLLFTARKKGNDMEYQKVVKFEHDGFQFVFKLKSVHSLQFYAENGEKEEHDHKIPDNTTDDEDSDIDEVSSERRDQVLTFIVQSILSQSGFKYIKMGQTQGWFPANNNTELNHVDPVYDNSHSKFIGVLRGFKAKICKSERGLSLKVYNENKILHSNTLQQELKDMYKNSYDDRDFQRKIKGLYGRKALYLPMMCEVKIESINLDKNENSTFILKSDGPERVISHKQNLLERKIVNKVDKENYGLVENKKGYSFLPQFMYLLFHNELIYKRNKEALETVQNDSDHELKSVQSFVKHIINVENKQKDKEENKSDDGKVDILSVIKISPNPYTTDGYILPKMHLSFKSDRGKDVNCDELTISKEWSKIHGLITAPTKGINAILIGDNNQYVDDIRKHIDGYFSKRNFRERIINDIHKLVPRNLLADSFPSKLRKKLTKTQEYDLMILILPTTENGSRLKREIHRICVELGIKSQCIDDSLFHDSWKKQRNKVWGMMDDVMYKLGATTYKVLQDPLLRVDINKSLVLGLDVCHPTGYQWDETANRPSIAVLTSLYGNIMAPNVSQLKSCMHLNNTREEICGYNAMLGMCVNVITQQLLRPDIDTLPDVIWMFRDGISDSQIPSMVNKEMNAFLSAVTEIKKMREIKDKYEGINEWEPKYEWLVVQKRILDRFAVKRNGRNTMKLLSHFPVFISPKDIVSGRFFEFYMKIGKRKPHKIMFIKDDLKLGEGGLMDVAKYIYSTHWLYPPCVPFSMGPLGYPAPIKYADKYASMWQDFITNDDYSINDLKSHPKLPYPQIVDTYINTDN